MTEDHRVAMRNIRRDGNEAVKKLAKDKKITEDEDKRAHEEIQKLTDKAIADIDKQFAQKEIELMAV